MAMGKVFRVDSFKFMVSSFSVERRRRVKQNSESLSFLVGGHENK